MAIGTPFHARAAPLNQALNWREWSGYHAAGRYHDFHQPEYAAIRNAVAVIDVSPLCKYRISGPGAAALVDRVFTRDGHRQIGRASSGFWSSLLKKYVAIASLEAPHGKIGGTVGMEITIDHCRKQAPAKVVELPFFRPERMRS